MIDEYIKNKKDCSGCTACFAVCPTNCITMEADDDGFAYPVVNHRKCVECGVCVTSCPIQYPLTGQMLDAYALYNNNKYIRKKSTSGGFFYVLAHYVITGLDGVVFGARFDESMQVIHTYATTVEAIKPLMGSKYVNSDLKNSFHEVKQFLKKGLFVLFSGLPCQIAGLKAFLDKEYPNLITLDVFCYGVSSHTVFDKYLSEYDNSDDIIDFKFRAKDISWTDYGAKVVYANGAENFSHHLENDYMYLYLNNYFFRPACYSCIFKTKSKVSDFFIGDYWNVQDHHRNIYDKYGVSAVFVNTEKGRIFFDKISNQFSIQTTSYDKIRDHNIALDTSASKPKYPKISKLLIQHFSAYHVVKVLKIMDYD